VEQAEQLFQEQDYRSVQILLQQFLLDRPGSRYREEAMYWLGRSQLEMGLDFEAEDQFQALLRDFPGGDYAPDANYYLGVALQKQSRPPSLDQSETLAALARLQSFVTRYPDDELVPEAQKRIQELRSKLAEKAYKNGRTYMKGKHYGPAEFYFRNRVIEPYADTRWAPKANLELVRAFENSKQYAKALEWSDYLIQHFPDAPEAKLAAELRCQDGLKLAKLNEQLYWDGRIPAVGAEALKWATFVVGECPGTGEAKDAREIARKLVDAGVTPGAGADSASTDPEPR